MTNITINTKNNTLVITKKFEKAASKFGSPEYKELKEARADFPNFKVVVRTVKQKKETYKGLTYEYMETYIKKYEPKETREAVLKEFEDKLFISECHSKGRRYPAIKKWFLEKYPEVAKFGMPNSNMPTEESQDEETNINAEPEFQKAS